MKTVISEKEKKVEELLGVLDKDIEYLELSLSSLNELRSMVIKRDDALLGRLLEIIQQRSGCYRGHELSRESLRKELAVIFCCSSEEMTLSRLEIEEELAVELREQITAKKERLSFLAGQLKNEHKATFYLLSECTRINKMLLHGMLDFGGPGTVSYNSNGTASKQADTSFINMRF
jgi:hypothetical protein